MNCSFLIVPYCIFFYNKYMAIKEKVFQILSENKNSVISGQVIAQECNVSRAAVWKAISALRNEGCKIEGTTNGGYVLSESPDIFSKEILHAELEKKFPQYSECHVECFKEIDSTNSYAKRLLSEAGSLRDSNGKLTPGGKKYHKSIFVAESQSAGRGRLGRTFVSPAKTGIYLSVIYAPENSIEEPAKLTAFSAVAVCRVLKELYDVQPKIKWINDIYINEKKVAGILTEGFVNFETSRIESAVVGIGINISDNPEFFSSGLENIAGSINGNCKNEIPRCTLAARIAGEVFGIFEEDSSHVIEEYRRDSFLIGKTVEVHPFITEDKSVYEAKVIDIDDSVRLVVELPDGSKQFLNSGEVSLHSV